MNFKKWWLKLTWPPLSAITPVSHTFIEIRELWSLAQAFSLTGKICRLFAAASSGGWPPQSVTIIQWELKITPLC